VRVNGWGWSMGVRERGWVVVGCGEAGVAGGRCLRPAALGGVGYEVVAGLGDGLQGLDVGCVESGADVAPGVEWLLGCGTGVMVPSSDVAEQCVADLFPGEVEPAWRF
jgi:hypothetical protein